MQLERVSEILKSPDNIEVLYNNNPVWIDDIDEDKKTVSVRFLNSDETLEVPVNELEETGRSLEFR
jgi:small acid-soluble spore protein H (minor)